MRVISGSAKGRRLKSGNDYSIRPTSDKVREAIFDILQGKIEGRIALDLFAGTGALGIEALSRGAQFATFVDNSAKALRLIKENLETTGFSRQAKIIKLKLPEQTKKLTAPGANLVFIDPPYSEGYIDRLLMELERLDLVAAEAIIVCEHSGRERVLEEFGKLRLIRRRDYSTTAVSFYERLSQ